MLELHEFWNIQYDGKYQRRQNKCQGMNPLWFPQYSKSVSDGFADSEESLECYGHDQEALAGDGDVLDGVDEEGEEDGVDVGVDFRTVVSHDTEEEDHLNNSQGYQALRISNWTIE